jgi:hypothetical protein
LKSGRRRSTFRGMVAPIESKARFFTLLAERISDGDVEDVLRMLRDALQADESVRCTMGPGDPVRLGGGKYVYVSKPDWRARLKAGELILNFKCIPPPSLKEVHILHSKTAAQLGGRQISGADVLKALKSQGANIREVLDAYMGQLEAVAPELKQLPAGKAREADAIDLPE